MFFQRIWGLNRWSNYYLLNYKHTYVISILPFDIIFNFLSTSLLSGNKIRCRQFIIWSRKSICHQSILCSDANTYSVSIWILSGFQTDCIELHFPFFSCAKIDLEKNDPKWEEERVMLWPWLVENCHMMNLHANTSGQMNWINQLYTDTLSELHKYGVSFPFNKFIVTDIKYFIFVTHCGLFVSRESMRPNIIFIAVNFIHIYSIRWKIEFNRMYTMWLCE